MSDRSPVSTEPVAGKSPSFSLPSGKYPGTNVREVTVEPVDAGGKQDRSLSDDATIGEATRLIAGRPFIPRWTANPAPPDNTPTDVFPMSPGIAMPAVQGWSKRDYQVLIVMGMMFVS